VTWTLIGLEFTLGTVLLLGPARLARAALLGSAALLVVFCIYVLRYEPAMCNCAGRLMPLDVFAHTFLVSVLLALVGLGWRFRRRAPPHWTRGVGAALLVIMAVLPVSMSDANKADPDSGTVVVGSAEGGAESARARPATLKTSHSIPRLPPDMPARRSPDALSLTGRVFASDDHQPIEGATLVARLDGTGNPRQVVRSGPQGAFQVPLVGAADATKEQAARATTLVAWAEGFEPRRVLLPSAAGVVDVPLERGEILAGVVRDQFGDPVVGCRVRAVGAGGADFARRGQEFLSAAGALPRYGVTTSDSRGRFTVRGLHPGEYKLNALPVGYVRPPVGGDIRVKAGQTDCVLRLRLVRVVRVHAIDATTGRTIPDARIDFKIPDWNRQDLPHPDPSLLARTVAGAPYPNCGASTIALAPESREDEQVAIAMASALGYEPATLTVAMTWNLDSASVAIPLRRVDGQSRKQVPVTVLWGDDRPYSGILEFLVRSTESRRVRHRINLKFDEGGHSVASLPLLSGPQEVRLVGGLMPSPYRGRVVRKVRIDPTEEVPKRLVFHLIGAALLIQPHLAEGGPRMTQFEVGVKLEDPTATSGFFMSEGGPFALGVDVSRQVGGSMLMLPPGHAEITLRAYGCKPVKRIMEIPESGGPQNWSPSLTPSDLPQK